MKMQTSKYYDLLKVTIDKTDYSQIDLAVDMIRSTIANGNWVFTCGNGGSALTASHFVTDWGKMKWVNQKKQFKTMCLSDNVGMVTAYSNDISYADTFSESLGNYGSDGDLLVLISGSGNSVNVVNAAIRARELGIKTIGVLGFSGGSLKSICDIAVHFPVDDMQVSEDLHLSFGHIVMKALCSDLSIRW